MYSNVFMLLEVLNGIEYKSFKVGNWFALVEFLISLIIVILLNKNKNIKCFLVKRKKQLIVLTKYNLEGLC